MKIYTVQVLYIKDKTIKRHRNWGYFESFEEAEEVILNNDTDIYENNWYDFGLINEVPPGICIGHMIVDTWYQVDYSKMVDEFTPTVTKCDKPISRVCRVGLDW